MDWLSMLMNAKIRDMDGDEIGEVLGVHIAGGKMILSVDDGVDIEDDPDDGEKEDIPEDDASNAKFPKIVAVGGERKKTGTNE